MLQPAPLKHTHMQTQAHTQERPPVCCSQVGEGPDPRPWGLPAQGCLISSRINHAEGWGAPQIPQANMQVKQRHSPRKGLFKLTKRGRNQATKPALSSEVNLCPPALWGGNLSPSPCPLLPLLLAYPRPELSTAQATIPDLLKVKWPCELRDPLPPQQQSGLFSWWGPKVAPDRGTGPPEQN